MNFAYLSDPKPAAQLFFDFAEDDNDEPPKKIAKVPSLVKFGDSFARCMIAAIKVGAHRTEFKTYFMTNGVVETLLRHWFEFHELRHVCVSQILEFEDEDEKLWRKVLVNAPTVVMRVEWYAEEGNHETWYEDDKCHFRFTMVSGNMAHYDVLKYLFDTLMQSKNPFTTGLCEEFDEFTVQYQKGRVMFGDDDSLGDRSAYLPDARWHSDSDATTRGFSMVDKFLLENFADDGRFEDSLNDPAIEIAVTEAIAAAEDAVAGAIAVAGAVADDAVTDAVTDAVADAVADAVVTDSVVDDAVVTDSVVDDAVADAVVTDSVVDDAVTDAVADTVVDDGAMEDDGSSDDGSESNDGSDDGSESNDGSDDGSESGDDDDDEDAGIVYGEGLRERLVDDGITNQDFATSLAVAKKKAVIVEASRKDVFCLFMENDTVITLMEKFLEFCSLRYVKVSAKPDVGFDMATLEDDTWGHYTVITKLVGIDVYWYPSADRFDDPEDWACGDLVVLQFEKNYGCPVLYHALKSMICAHFQSINPMDPHKVEDSDSASYKFRRGRFWLTEDGKDIDYDHKYVTAFNSPCTVDICDFSHLTVGVINEE